jgi:hypothetical protein
MPVSNRATAATFLFATSRIIGCFPDATVRAFGEHILAGGNYAIAA